MAKFKVCYSGYAYVEADDADEAEDNFVYGINDYEEKSIDLVLEVGESWEV
ncbi:MAG: hypothetical protein IKY91_02575 [Akkermansia sp.]|nr:hypothetical protein [Akkermansia sp.]